MTIRFLHYSTTANPKSARLEKQKVLLTESRFIKLLLWLCLCAHTSFCTTCYAYPKCHSPFKKIMHTDIQNTLQRIIHIWNRMLWECVQQEAFADPVDKVLRPHHLFLPCCLQTPCQRASTVFTSASSVSTSRYQRWLALSIIWKLSSVGRRVHRQHPFILPRP